MVLMLACCRSMLKASQFLTTCHLTVFRSLVSSITLLNLLEAVLQL